MGSKIDKIMVENHEYLSPRHHLPSLCETGIQGQNRFGDIFPQTGMIEFKGASQGGNMVSRKHGIWIDRN